MEAENTLNKRHRRCSFSLRVGKSPWRRTWQPPLQYSSLENPMDRRAWHSIVHGIIKNQTQLSMHAHTYIYTHIHGLPRWCYWLRTHLPVQKTYKRLGSVPGSGRFLGGRHGNLLQYSCLENLMDRGAWQAFVHGITKNQT